MSLQNKINLFFLFLLATALALACSGGNELSKANKLVGEANAADVEGGKSLDDANKRLSQLFSSDVSFEDRKKLEPTAKDTVESINKAQAKIKEAIQKLDEARNLNVPDWYKEYLSALVDRYRNTDALVDVIKDMAKAYMDFSITEPEALLARYKELQAKMDKLNKEGEDLDAKVKKIEEANKDKFKS